MFANIDYQYDAQGVPLPCALFSLTHTHRAQYTRPTESMTGINAKYHLLLLRACNDDKDL